MKKVMKIILAVIMVLSVVLCFNACDSGNASEDSSEEKKVSQNVTGRYELEKILWDDGTSILEETLQISEEAMGEMYVELFEDGTAILSLYGQITEMSFSDNEMWQTTYKNNSYEFSVSGGTVTLKRAGDTFTFVRK